MPRGRHRRGLTPRNPPNSADAKSMYGKMKATGIVCVKTKQTVVVGFYDDKIQPGQCSFYPVPPPHAPLAPLPTGTTVVERLADYLVESCVPTQHTSCIVTR